MANNSFDLTGKVVLVTGASSGLGRHFAEILAAAGAKVAIAARRLEALSDLAARIEERGGRAIPMVLDVTDRESIVSCVNTTETELGPISVLVNNAGVAVTKPLLECGEEDWDHVVETNLKGVWLVAQETAKHMERLGHGGSIINIASVLGLFGTGQVAGYCASKGGVVNLTRAMAAELARHDIRVNALAPGYIETDINRDFLASEAGQKLKRKIPQRRFGRLEDLDGALLLLASDASAYMTGSIIVIDGGQTAAI